MSNTDKALVEIRTFTREESLDKGIDYDAVIINLMWATGSTQITDIRGSNSINEDTAAELGIHPGNIKRVRESSENSACTVAAFTFVYIISKHERHI